MLIDFLNSISDSWLVKAYLLSIIICSAIVIPVFAYYIIKSRIEFEKFERNPETDVSVLELLLIVFVLFLPIINLVLTCTCLFEYLNIKKFLSKSVITGKQRK